MKERQDKRKWCDARLEMTPMIDVVFLLLVFFVVTIRPHDVLAKLDVARPATSDSRFPIIPPLRIDVGAQGYVINGQKFSLASIQRRLKVLHENKSDISVIVACQPDAPHENLVKLLDCFAAVGIRNISLTSL